RPFLLEEDLRRVGGAAFADPVDLLAHLFEVEGRPGAAALESRRGPVPVGDEPVDADAKESPQPRARRVEPRDQLLLDDLCEELWREVSRFLVGPAPSQSQVAVD